MLEECGGSSTAQSASIAFDSPFDQDESVVTLAGAIQILDDPILAPVGRGTVAHNEHSVASIGGARTVEDCLIVLALYPLNG